MSHNQELERYEQENAELRLLQNKTMDESLYHEQQYLDIQTKFKMLEAENEALSRDSQAAPDSFENLDLIKKLQTENDLLKIQIRNFTSKPEVKTEIAQKSQVVKENNEKLTGRIQNLDNEGILLINLN